MDIQDQLALVNQQLIEILKANKVVIATHEFEAGTGIVLKDLETGESRRWGMKRGYRRK